MRVGEGLCLELDRPIANAKIQKRQLGSRRPHFAGRTGISLREVTTGMVRVTWKKDGSVTATVGNLELGH